ncbi:MAG TPA: S8 family serine peptidase [Bacilli bacterium]|nr:S8 family serine peptidase [Bacilli bacterium]
MRSIPLIPRLRRSGLVSLLAIAAAAPACGTADTVDPEEDLAARPAPASVPVSEAEMDTRQWFIELEQPPLALGGALDAIRADKTALREAARSAGLELSPRFSYERLWNGVSVRADRGQLAALARLPGVKAIFPVQRARVASAPPNAGELLTSLSMTGADVAQDQLGLTGAGVKVAVIDTGVDYHHPDLGGCFGPGCRVAFGHDFVGDAYDDDAGTPPVPDADPDDCGGHGTAVAGVLAADGAIRGVAPGVTLGAYRVFGCSGSTGDDTVLSALEQADADGMQVVNMSIVYDFQWPEYPTAQASTRLVEKGVIVVAAAGNSGVDGLYSASAPAVGDGVISVASFENTHRAMNYFEVSPGGARIGVQVAAGSMPHPTSGSAPLARTGTPSTLDDGCAPLPPGSLTGKVALIRRGTCPFTQKVQNAAAAGATAVVIYNNVIAQLSPNLFDYVPPIPVVGISGLEGQELNELLDTGPLTLTWKDGIAPIPLPTAGQISWYSSYGLSPDLQLKPDLGAPGGEVFTLDPLELGGYRVQNGTSMAAPHVAGAAALLLEAHPWMSPKDVSVRLMNQADPQPSGGGVAQEALEHVHRQGAGMVDVDDAILATSRVKPASLSLGESGAGPTTRALEIHNDSDAAVTYHLSHAPALSTVGATRAPVATEGFASVVFSADTVTVPAYGSASIEVAIKPDAALESGAIYGGYVVLLEEGSGRALRVPYAGYQGDYQEIEVLTPTVHGFPWLAREVAGSYQAQSDGAVFTLVGDDVPQLLVHLDHHARRLQLDVFDAGTMKPMHRAARADYLPRSGPAEGFVAFAWDGTTTDGKNTFTLPDGQYIVRISVLKALGDKQDPTHWERWDSPVLTIDRP